MLVIKGLMGKSVKFNKYLTEYGNDEDTLIIDFENVAQIFPKGFKVLTFDQSIDELLDMFDNIYENTNLKRYAFYANTHESNIPKFKKLENEYGIEVILTIQSHSSENMKKPILYNV